MILGIPYMNRFQSVKLAPVGSNGRRAVDFVGVNGGARTRWNRSNFPGVSRLKSAGFLAYEGVAPERGVRPRPAALDHWSYTLDDCNMIYQNGEFDSAVTLMLLEMSFRYVLHGKPVMQKLQSEGSGAL